jgi:hypothetical protein
MVTAIQRSSKDEPQPRLDRRSVLKQPSLMEGRLLHISNMNSMIYSTLTILRYDIGIYESRVRRTGKIQSLITTENR